MTSLIGAENGLTRESKRQTDDIIHMYGSTASHISEETEYVRKIRTTLEKIHSQLFKDEGNGNILHSTHEKMSADVRQNGVGVNDGNSFGSRYRQIIEKLKDKDLQLVEIHKENENLQIKLEATREAGASVIRTVTRKLYENYNKQSDQLRKNHEEQRNKTQASAAEQEVTLKKSIDKLHEVAEKIQEKHGRIVQLENLMQRMEDEKITLLAKKRALENEISRRMSDPAHMNGCADIQMEISTVKEQINHLQQLMMSQHQFLHSLIQESEELKNRLKDQDNTIGDLKEKINALEWKNKELKHNVEHWSDKKLKMSKATWVSESMFGGKTVSPYFMLRNLQSKSGTEKS
ncbi:coiled-coil domain-containing protein 68 [Rhinophrynus dorsalis]